MPDNGKWRSYVLKARRTLAKSWQCPLLVCEQDKVKRRMDIALDNVTTFIIKVYQKYLLVSDNYI